MKNMKCTGLLCLLLVCFRPVSARADVIQLIVAGPAPPPPISSPIVFGTGTSDAVALPVNPWSNPIPLVPNGAFGEVGIGGNGVPYEAAVTLTGIIITAFPYFAYAPYSWATPIPNVTAFQSVSALFFPFGVGNQIPAGSTGDTASITGTLLGYLNGSLDLTCSLSTFNSPVVQGAPFGCQYAVQPLISVSDMELVLELNTPVVTLPGGGADPAAMPQVELLNSANLEVVPEPSSFTLISVGLTGLLAIALVRRKRVANGICQANRTKKTATCWSTNTTSPVPSRAPLV